MRTHALMALAIAGAPRAPAPACTLGGPPVEAPWCGKVTVGVWHELRVQFQRLHVDVYWDGTKRIDARDRTFSGPGRVGVWTKADSYTLFDDLTARPRR